MSSKKKEFLKNGIWLKEQNGFLTVGVLDDTPDQGYVIIDSLAENIISAADEIHDAIFGAAAVRFNPKNINIRKLLEEAFNEVDANDIKISIHCPREYNISGDYNSLLKIISGLIKNSMNNNGSNEEAPFIYINATVVENRLCLIYRDSGNCRDMKSLYQEIDSIKNKLKGEVQLHDSGKNPYLDILIPEQSS